MNLLNVNCTTLGLVDFFVLILWKQRQFNNLLKGYVLNEVKMTITYITQYHVKKRFTFQVELSLVQPKFQFQIICTPLLNFICVTRNVTIAAESHKTYIYTHILCQIGQNFTIFRSHVANALRNLLPSPNFLDCFLQISITGYIVITMLQFLPRKILLYMYPLIVFILELCRISLRLHKYLLTMANFIRTTKILHTRMEVFECVYKAIQLRLVCVDMKSNIHGYFELLQQL